MGIRVRAGNFKSDDLPELELVAGPNVTLDGAQGDKTIQVTVTAANNTQPPNTLPPLTGDLSLNGFKATNSAAPTAGTDLVNKTYADALANGLTVKASVRAATTANLTLSGTQTVDGVALIAGDRVLVKDQSTGANNGIYVVAAGAWSRSTDADTSPEVLAGMFTFVTEGTTHAEQGWVLATNNPITLGTTALVFTQFSGGGGSSGTAGGDLTGTYPNPTLAAAGPGATGPVGSGTVTPVITIDGKGRVTALGSAAITAGGSLTGVSAWSTTLAASTTLSGTSIQITTSLPAAFTGTTFWVVIDAYTPNAEVRPAGAGSDSLHITVDLADTSNFANTHAAGASVIVAQEGLWATWFGVKQNFLGSRTGQVAAMNQMFNQSAKLGFGYRAPCFLGPGLWQMDAGTIVVQGNVFDLKGGQLNWAGNDAGAGTGGIDVATHGGTLLNGTLVGPAADSSKAGGTLGVDPACMDGAHVTNSSMVDGMVFSNFRNGVVENGFNHATMRDTRITNCYYGIYRSGGSSFGDNKYDRVNINTNRLAGFAVASGQRMAADSFYDCHIYGAPTAFYAESGGGFGPILYRTSIESIGNSAFYTKSTSGIGATFMESSCAVVAWDNTNYGLGSLQGPAVFVNNSGGDCTLSLGGDLSQAYQASSEYVNGQVSLLGGTSRWLIRGANISQLGNFAHAAWNAGLATATGPCAADEPAFPSAIRYNNPSGRGEAKFCEPLTNGTITRGMLVEGNGHCQPYQTAGGPPYGVALEADPNLGGGALCLFTAAVSGDVYINVSSGNSIAQGKWLKPDVSHNGMVVAASDFTDGPIVGWALAAAASLSGYGSSKTVLARLV